MGIPSALSYSLLKDITWHELPIIEIVDFVCTGILIPLGGFLTVLLVGWRWGIKSALVELNFGAQNLCEKHPFLKIYLSICVRFVAPFAILVILIEAVCFF